MKISFYVLPSAPRPNFSEPKNFARGEQGRGKIFRSDIKVLPPNKVNQIFLSALDKKREQKMPAFFHALLENH